tara:strand:+ start:2426 stop:3718 length:1293 start_codon:yes stop_codon:yes gene_type:complete
MKIKIGTDFSGIGSPEQALKNLNIDFESIFACEIDKYARNSFQAIHETKTMYEDITKREHGEVPQLDLYVAGFPCQSFSIAGKRKGFEETRGTLFFDVAQFIKTNQPKMFILENVKGLLSHESGRTFQTITDVLSNGGGTVNGQMSFPVFDDGLGYHIFYKVLNSKNFGIPQNRERIFICGFKDYKQFSFPKPINLELKLKDVLQDNPDSKFSIQEIKEKFYLSSKQRNFLSNYKRGIGFTDPNKKNVANCIVAGYHKIPGDGEYIKVPEKYYLSKKAIKRVMESNFDDEKPMDFSRQDYKENGICKTLKVGGDVPCFVSNIDQPKRLYQYNNSSRDGRWVYDKDGISPCLMAGMGMGGGIVPSIENENVKEIKNSKIRRLTPLECWRLQGFSDEAYFKAAKISSDTQLYKQAGNSITVDVMMHLLNKLL